MWMTPISVTMTIEAVLASLRPVKGVYVSDATENEIWNIFLLGSGQDVKDDDEDADQLTS